MIVKRILSEMIKERKDKNIVPNHVTFIELSSRCLNEGISFLEVKESLNKMFYNKEIKTGYTINDKWVSLTKM